ncbi:MAG TPA: ABC transporter permease subunit [Bryobacteraceae bacterium]|nr:ABC transporter permease subunit [Bryobacteraceae bacterium]
MTQTLALIWDTFREASARKIFWGLFGLSTATILFFLFLLKIDLVEGALATVTLFGRTSNRSMEVDKLVSNVFGAIAGFLYTVGMFLAVFASAGLIASVLEPGRIELLLSKPVSRVHILLGRFLGNVLIVAAIISYLIVGVWLILGFKTGIWSGRFLVTIGMTVGMFAVLLTVVVLTGVIWESTALSTMVPVAMMLISPILAQNKIAERLLSSEWSRDAWNGLYYTLPKVYDFGRITHALVLRQPVESWMPLWSSAIFGAIVLSAGLYVFARRDF